MMRPSIFRETFFDDFFGDFVRPAFEVAKYNVPNTGMMRTDVKELESTYELDIDLPGYGKEDVEAELKDGYLTITAKKNETKDQKDDKGNYIRRERYTGSCTRSYFVGEQVKEEDIKARFDNGILKLSIPKEAAKKEEVRKLITIE